MFLTVFLLIFWVFSPRVTLTLNNTCSCQYSLCLSFSCQITLASISRKKKWNNYGDHKYLLFLILIEMLLELLLINMMWALRIYIYIYIWFVCVKSRIYHEGIEMCRCLFSIYWDMNMASLLWAINMLNHADRFLNVELLLYSLDKPFWQATLLFFYCCVLCANI